MTVSLFQPILNASATPLFYPPPSPEDVYNCNGFYSQSPSSHVPPSISDCRQAFKKLPIGPTGVPWWTSPGPERDNILPIEVHHGGCEIVFHTSGPVAQSENPTWIVPNDIRAMANWVLGRCVYTRKGGMVTKNLANSIDYVTNTSIDFWDTPYRTFDNVDSCGCPVVLTKLFTAAASTSFYSLHIWTYDDSEEADIDWNPGDNEPDVANKIADVLKLASLAASGDEQDELDGRLNLIQEAEYSMERNDDKWVWWKIKPDFAQSRSNASKITSLNGTGNLTVA